MKVGLTCVCTHVQAGGELGSGSRGWMWGDTGFNGCGASGEETSARVRESKEQRCCEITVNGG